jgi:hypothetical protein
MGMTGYGRKGLVFATALVVVNAIAVLSASAENTKMLPEGTAALPVTFTATSGEGSFESASGIELKCKADEATGEETSANLGAFHIHFTGCTSLLGSTCTGLGDASGTELWLGTFHFWLYKTSGGALSAALVYLINPTHFECAGILTIVEGCVAGGVSPLESLTTSITNTLNRTGAKQEITKVLPQESTKEIACELTQKTSEGESGASAEKTEEHISKFEQSKKAVTVLFMS